MKRLYLMRHAEAEKAPDQDDDHLFSTGDRSLSARGQAQAREAAGLLDAQGIEAIYTSPARRCRETAELVAAPLGLGVTVDERLWELPLAEPGDGYEAVLDALAHLARVLGTGGDPKLPGGHRFRDEVGRYQAAVDDAVERHQRTLVVGHGAQNRVFLGRLLGMPDHALFRLEQDHACVNVVALGGKRRVVLKVNVTPEPLWTEESSFARGGASDALG